MATLKEREQLRSQIAAACRRLILSQRMVELCEHATPKQEEFLAYILEQEVLQREQNRRARQLSRACFPVLKSFEGYEYGAIRFPPTISREDLLSCNFIGEKKNLILYGPVGIGKTHLAIALGAKACQLGMNVRFYTVTELVLKLGDAHRSGTLERLIRDLQRLDLLILDEWGYVPIDKEGSQLLFRVVADSYESKSLILTTNLEFSKWGSIFTDEQMAAAMIDRLIHHGHLLIFEGQSYRMAHALMRQTTKSPS
jgi:DNA replication protein DnaC